MYFALPPKLTLQTVEGLSPRDLPPETLLVLEKPFGSDQASARDLNRRLVSLVPEERIFRVDHFLGMTTVMNIVGMRFSNRLLEPIWNSLHIEKMEIVFDEQLALEGRAKYYDASGALEDMIQSHLLHTMAFMAMGPPATLGERDLRDLVARHPARILGQRGLPQVHPPCPLYRRRDRREGKSRGTPTPPEWIRRGTLRPWRRLRLPSTTTAGRVCRSSCARARPGARTGRKQWSRSAP